MDTDLTALLARATRFYDRTARALQASGGHLECSVCGRVELLGDVRKHVRSGWPKCCTRTMSWITARQERERAAAEAGASFTCPVCGAVSHNPHDVAEGYCGRCHDWTAQP